MKAAFLFDRPPVHTKDKLIKSWAVGVALLIYKKKSTAQYIRLLYTTFVPQAYQYLPDAESEKRMSR